MPSRVVIVMPDGAPAKLAVVPLMLDRVRLLEQTRDQILEEVWDYDIASSPSVLETYISYLRKKLDVVDPPLIHTIRGEGYRLSLSA